MPAAARPATQVRSLDPARRTRRPTATPVAPNQIANRVRADQSGLGQQPQRQAVRVGDVAVRTALAVVGESVAALAGAGDRRFAELVEGHAPDVVTRSSDAAEAGPSPAIGLDLGELVPLVPRVVDRVAGPGEGDDTGGARSAPPGSRWRRLARRGPTPGGRRPLSKTKAKRPTRNEAGAEQAQRDRGVGDLGRGRDPGPGAGGVVGLQQRPRTERHHADRGQGEPGAAQAVGADQERDGAARRKTEEQPSRLGEEGEAEQEHGRRDRRARSPEAKPRRAAAPTSGQTAKAKSAAVPLR